MPDFQPVPNEIPHLLVHQQADNVAAEALGHREVSMTKLYRSA